MRKPPFCASWVVFKNETVFAMWNYEASKKANKPMYDIAFCATDGLNGSFQNTVQFDKSKFKPVDFNIFNGERWTN